jgi:hypothetical protein
MKAIEQALVVAQMIIRSLMTGSSSGAQSH